MAADDIIDVIVVAPGDGTRVRRRFGEQTTIKLRDPDTGGGYALRENEVPAGFDAVPFHRHLEAEEAFYVLDGELTLTTPDAAWTLPAGAVALVRRGTVHAIANRGDRPLRWLTLISPAWVSGWIEEEGALLESSSRPTPEQVAAVYRKYALELVPDETG